MGIHKFNLLQIIPHFYDQDKVDTSADPKDGPVSSIGNIIPVAKLRNGWLSAYGFMTVIFKFIFSK